MDHGCFSAALWVLSMAALQIQGRAGEKGRNLDIPSTFEYSVSLPALGTQSAGN
jgi:hypothetical protein